jgi:HPt (histidine-containing phosphotransfer) domain-containing protein
MEDLLARFLPQFIALARTRIAVAITNAQKSDAAASETMARELHTLVGEAGLLGLSAVVPLARDCEQKAKYLGHVRSEAEAQVLIAALRELEAVIEGIGAAHPSKGDP